MAPASKKEAASFDAIIKAERQKKQHQSLADQLLGKGRRASAPGAGAAFNKKAPVGGSLASRVGIQKRSSSTANLRAPTRPASAALLSRSATNSPRPARNQTPNTRPNARQQQVSTPLKSGPKETRVRSTVTPGGISIRGLAGPLVVVGKNFAPGTTAADIESALQPVGGDMLSCEIVSTDPIIVVEMTFAEKEGAEKVIKAFNNKRADGRIISLGYKPTNTTIASPRQPQQSEPEYSSMEVDPSSNAMMDSEDQSYARRSTNTRYAEPEIQDGSYGFEDPNPPPPAPAADTPMVGEPIPTVDSTPTGPSNSFFVDRRDGGGHRGQGYSNGGGNNYRPGGDGYRRGDFYGGGGGRGRFGDRYGGGGGGYDRGRNQGRGGGWR